MQALTEERSHLTAFERERAWPLDARMAMFVLEAGGADPQFTRERAAPRQACRIIATLCGDDPHALAQTIVYVRDMNDGHFGFISQVHLPVGATMSLHCSTDQGGAIRTACEIGRSRPFMTGWNEG